AERIADENSAPGKARVHEIQLALASDLAEVRTVPAKLAALSSHRAIAREAMESLSDSRFSLANLGLRTLIESTKQRARLLLDLLDNGGPRATKLIDQIDHLTYARIGSWS